MMNTNRIGTERLKKNHGFTLIEIIAVLVIMAIVSAVVLSRGTATDEANLQAEVATLKGHLRYAQYLAMNDITDVKNENNVIVTVTKWGINVEGSSYTLIKVITGTGAGTSNPFNLPNESSATHNFAPPITASSSITPILFDDWGSPGSADITITMGTQTITITANTGFIP